MFKIDYDEKVIMVQDEDKTLYYNGEKYFTNYLKRDFNKNLNILYVSSPQLRENKNLVFDFLEKYYNIVMKNRALGIILFEGIGVSYKTLLIEKWLSKNGKEDFLFDVPFLTLINNYLRYPFDEKDIDFFTPLLTFYSQRRNKVGKKQGLIDAERAWVNFTRIFNKVKGLSEEIKNKVWNYPMENYFSFFLNSDDVNTHLLENIACKIILDKPAKIPNNSNLIIGFYNLIQENKGLQAEVGEISATQKKKEIEKRRKDAQEKENLLNEYITDYSVKILKTSKEFEEAGKFFKNCIGGGHYYNDWTRNPSIYYMIFVEKRENRPAICTEFRKKEKKFFNTYSPRNFAVSKEDSFLLRNTTIKNILMEG